MEKHHLYQLTDSHGQTRFYLDDLELMGVQSIDMRHTIDEPYAEVRLTLHCAPGPPRPEMVQVWTEERALRAHQWKKELSEEFMALLQLMKPEEENED